MNDPADSSVEAFVEHAYLRMQAGDVLMRCIEEDSPLPMQQIVQELVLAGPQSLGVLREILAETGERKAQVADDIQQVFSEFQKGLKSYGVRLTGLRTPLSITRLTPARFLTLIDSQALADEEAREVCLKMLQESRSLIKNLAHHQRLLKDIEIYLQDWMWGVAYQMARSEDEKKH